MNREEIVRQVLDAAFKIHTKLGPGLLEASYEACLAYELRKQGLFVETQKALPLIYEEVHLEMGYRIDLLIENEIIVEIKSVEAMHERHIAQVLTYLNLADKELGLLINFNVKSLKDGLKRVINSKTY